MLNYLFAESFFLPSLRPIAIFLMLLYTALFPTRYLFTFRVTPLYSQHRNASGGAMQYILTLVAGCKIETEGRDRNYHNDDKIYYEKENVIYITESSHLCSASAAWKCRFHPILGSEIIAFSSRIVF